MDLAFTNDEIDELADRLADRLDEKAPHLTQPEMETGDTICGINPHALYSVAFLEERWDVSESTVRRLDERGELSRVDWEGRGVRFRGIDILRYEGVDVNARAEPEEVPSEPAQDNPGGDGHAPSGDASYPDLPEL
jgi:hypothetical protein